MVSLLFRTVLLTLAFVLVEFDRSVFAAEPASPTKPAVSEMSANEFFERKVRPLFVEHCYSCHAKGQKKGGLSLADRAGLLAGGESGAVVALEKPDESLLIAAVEHRGGMQMPPNGKLSVGEIAVLKKWVELGAPWPESAANKSGGIRASGSITAEDRQFWSFQPVKDLAPPVVKNGTWPRQPLAARRRQLCAARSSRAQRAQAACARNAAGRQRLVSRLRRQAEEGRGALAAADDLPPRRRQ